MEAVCKLCNKIKPKSTLCKECAAAKQRIKVNCLICQKLISYGNMSKHMYSHNHNNPLKELIICACGNTICKYSLPKHLLSKKHKELI